MKRVLVALGLAVGLAGCVVQNTSNFELDTLQTKYVMDGRTGLCYAVSFYQVPHEPVSVMMASVPCSEDVMHLLE